VGLLSGLNTPAGQTGGKRSGHIKIVASKGFWHQSPKLLTQSDTETAYAAGLAVVQHRRPSSPVSLAPCLQGPAAHSPESTGAAIDICSTGARPKDAAADGRT